MDNNKNIHNLPITLKVGSVAPPFATNFTERITVKIRKPVPVRPTHHTGVKARLKSIP